MEDYYAELEKDDQEKFVLDENVQKKVRYQAKTPTIQTLYQDWKDGDLIIDPSFQRNYVWNKKKASNLIESILINIPLPIIFTSSKNGKEEVIDGQQRLTSIFTFLDGHFADGTKFNLSKSLKILSDEIGGKSFVSLDKTLQNAIKKYPLFMVSISEESDEDIKFEMFERLNTNITSLNAQELRNCLYRGGYNSFIRMLAKDKDFQYIINKPSYRKRMQDVELALMFCAFYNVSPEDYKKSLTQFLNYDMKENRIITRERIEDIEFNFKKSVQLVKHIWGNKAFSVSRIDEKSAKVIIPSSFNQGLFQILTHCFIEYEYDSILPFSDLIKEELINLQLHNQKFRDTITGSGTNSPYNMHMKFHLWRTTLQGVLDYPIHDSKAFSYKNKQKLWKKDSRCQICSKEIVCMDDAIIDDITCYWKDKILISENSKLMHRHCNILSSKAKDIGR